MRGNNHERNTVFSRKTLTVAIKREDRVNDATAVELPFWSDVVLGQEL